jgi:hypothetical protein
LALLLVWETRLVLASSAHRAKSQDISARSRPARLDAAQVSRRDISIQRQVQLANASNSAPATQQEAKIYVRLCDGRAADLEITLRL